MAVHTNCMEKKRMSSKEKTVIFVVVITAFVTTFTGSALNLSIPDISRQFGLSASASGWIITGYTLAVAICSIPAGKLADMKSRKTVLAAGLAVFVSCSIAAVFSVSGIMLIAVRLLQGIGAAMIFSTNIAILTDTFPEKQRGRVLGFSLAATYAGQSAGPVLGGVLNYNLGWKSIFIFTGTLAAAAFIMTFTKISNSEKKKDMQPHGRLFAGNPGFSAASIAALINYSSTFAISYLISIYLQNVQGFNSQTAGLIMISQPLIMAVFSPAAGKLSDRISPFKLSAIGMALCAAGSAAFIFLKVESSIWYVVIALAITGAGFALFSSPNTNAAMSCVKKGDYGLASSVLATMRSAGHTISMGAVTVMVNMYAADVSLAAMDTGSMIKVINCLFVGFAGVCACGTIVSIRRIH